MSDLAISINSVSKTYASGFKALKNVSFDVKQGEFFALLGPNGAGKTTLISAMAGLAKQTEGSISVMGHDTLRDPNLTRTNLGIVPQELVFDPFFTVMETLRFQSGYFGIKHNNAWLSEILERLGLEDKTNANMRALSGGMKRRVMIAQALVHKPPVIVLDEPTAGVDVELRQSLWSFIKELNQKGHTIILTTHYLEEAQNLCNRIAVLNHGHLIALDEKEKLLNIDTGVLLWLQLANEILPESLNSLFLRKQDNGLVLQLNDNEQIGFVIGELIKQQNKIEKMTVLQNDLEDVFLRLTHNDDVKGGQ